MIDADKRSITVHSYPLSANVWNTERRLGTRTATRWIAAEITTARTSGCDTSGRSAKSERVDERQLKPWKSGESARSENAIARARFVPNGSIGRHGQR